MVYFITNPVSSTGIHLLVSWYLSSYFVCIMMHTIPGSVHVNLQLLRKRMDISLLYFIQKIIKVSNDSVRLDSFMNLDKTSGIKGYRCSQVPNDLAKLWCILYIWTNVSLPLILSYLLWRNRGMKLSWTTRPRYTTMTSNFSYP